MEMSVPAVRCPSCSGFHDLFVPHNESEQYSTTGTYQYTCPATGGEVTTQPMTAGAVVSDSSPPSGTVAARRVA